MPGGEAFRADMNRLDDCKAQMAIVSAYFDELGAVMDRLPEPVADTRNDDSTQTMEAA